MHMHAWRVGQPRTTVIDTFLVELARQSPCTAVELGAMACLHAGVPTRHKMVPPQAPSGQKTRPHRRQHQRIVAAAAVLEEGRDVVGQVVWAGPKGAKVLLPDDTVGFMPSREAPCVIRDALEERLPPESSEVRKTCPPARCGHPPCLNQPLILSYPHLPRRQGKQLSSTRMHSDFAS